MGMLKSLSNLAAAAHAAPVSGSVSCPREGSDPNG